MIKKVLNLLLVICILGTICTPVVFGAEIQVPSRREAAKFGVSEYSDTSIPDSVHAEYASFNVGNWLEYTVKIQNAGTYYIGTYASHSGTSAIFSVSVDGETIGQGKIAPSGSWSDYSTLTKLVTCELTQGLHKIRITNVQSGIHVGFFEVGGVSENRNGTDFSRKSGSYKEVYLPTIINAEDYDIGAEGGYSNDGENSGRRYRTEEPLDIFEKSDVKGDYYVRLNHFEYANYSFNVTEASIYTMTLKTRGNGSLSVYLDDMPYPLVYNVTGKTAYSRTTPVNILLEEGTHRIKVACTYSMVYLDDIVFTTAQDAGDGYLTRESFQSEMEPVANANAVAEEPDYDALDAPNEVYKTIYVAPEGSDAADGSEAAPFATVERALSEVAKLTDAMTGDIVVSFAPGMYNIDKTQVLTGKHGGKNGYNVILRGADSEKKSVLSGGQQVTGWKQYNDLLWRAPVSGVEEVRNLYVNDYPAVRARSKYLYAYEEDYEGGFITSSVNFPKLSQPQYLETYWPIWWRLFMDPVEDVRYGDDGKVTFIMEKAAWNSPYTSVNPAVGTNFYLVNAMELLDEPGEFYYNKDDGYIYYYPYKAEDMTTAEAWVGKTELLFDIKGESKENRLTNLVFDNLAFRYGAWDEPSRLGLATTQSDGASDLETYKQTYNEDGTQIMKSPGQIKINNTENLCFTNCDFACIGSSALQITDSVKNVKIEGNIFRDINGAGIMIGAAHHSTANGRLAQTGTEPCENFMVRNNVFTRVAYEYQAQTAISVYFERNINIVNNDISHTAYSGITAGWGWEDTGQRSDYHQNVNITHNRISHTMENLIDGGPIYTLGNMGGSQLAYNYISDCYYMNGGLYLDAGSSELSLHHNVVEDAHYWFFLQSGYAAKDDCIYDNYSTSATWTKSGDLDNTVYKEPYALTKGGYPSEAIAIMQDAGVEEAYKHLVKEAELPSWMNQVNLGSPSQTFIPSLTFEPKFGWIQAEDFLPGEQGETYYDTKNEKNNNSYRSEGVGLLQQEFKAGDYSNWVIHECGTGEWMTYNVRIPADGSYTFKVNAAHNYDDGGHFNLYVDDELVIEKGTLPKGELGWGEMVVTSFDGIQMTAGEHIIKYEFQDGGHYLDAIGFFSDAYPPDAEPDPTKNAADYDDGVITYEPDGPQFEDIAGHYAEDDILAMQKAGIIEGMNETAFAPGLQLTREQAAWLCMRAADVTFEIEDWQSAAQSLGMLPQGAEYDGGAIISREEFAHMLMCAFRAVYGTPESTGKISFTDSSAISDSYYNEVVSACELGLLAGDTEGTFRPQSGLTRAEAAVAIRRLLEV